MGTSMRYKGKDCAYCGAQGASSTNDHVVAKSFFLDSERHTGLKLPQVPACQPCNTKKSKLELYIVTALLIGSKHPEADRYRSEKIAPRLIRNNKLRRELGIDSPPEWKLIDGTFQPIHVIEIDPDKTIRLLELIVRGLYRHHYGRTLPHEMRPDVAMIRPEAELTVWNSLSSYFPAETPRTSCTLGNGSFSYSFVKSPVHEGLTAWLISLHGNIPLHAADGTADHWWCITRPTSDALEASSDTAPIPS